MESLRVQKKTNALEVLSCGGVSSTDSSDSSDSERHVNVYPRGANAGANAGANLGSPPPPPPPPPNYSEDSDSKPFDVTRFENMLKAFAEKATEGSGAGVRPRCSNDSLSSRRSCFYALSAHCLDASDGLPKWGPKSQGVRGYLSDLHGLIATVEETDAGGVVTTFRPAVVLSFAGLVMSVALFHLEDPLFGTVFIVLLTAAYIFQVTLLHRRRRANSRQAAARNKILQKLLDMSIHNVVPCSACRAEFVQQGIFDFHNRVSCRLAKSHVCSPPYSGYDYLVSFLLWTMDSAMLELRGEGFITALPETASREMLNATEFINTTNNSNHSTRMYNSENSNSNNSNAANDAKDAKNDIYHDANDSNHDAIDAYHDANDANNANNNNGCMDYQPVPGNEECDFNESASNDSGSRGESVTSMDFLVLSQVSSDDSSEGYESATHHNNSPTTSMNVNNDDAATTTSEQDFGTFSLYTARSSVTENTETEEGEEEEDLDGSESGNASVMSSNFMCTARTEPSCNGSELTQQGSEDTTKSQCGSELSRSNRSRKNTRAPKKGLPVGDSALVNQLISHSIKEHASGRPANAENEQELRRQGYEQMAPSAPETTPCDTLNRNNNGNNFTKSRRAKYPVDEEANIDGCNQYFNADYTTSEDEDDGEDSGDDAEAFTRQIPCSLTEENDFQLTYAEDDVGDYNLEPSTSLMELEDDRGIPVTRTQEPAYRDTYIPSPPKPRHIGDGDLDPEIRHPRKQPPMMRQNCGVITLAYPESGPYPDSRDITYSDRRLPNTAHGRGDVETGDGEFGKEETIYVFPCAEETYPQAKLKHRPPPQRAPRKCKS